MKKKFLILISLILFFLMSPTRPRAATVCPFTSCFDGCTYEGQCVDGIKCVVKEYKSGTSTIKHLSKGNYLCGGSAVIGEILPPKGVAQFQGGLNGDIGILVFVSSALRLFFLIAGLLVLGNFIISAYDYITNAGDFKIHIQAKDRLTFSLYGIVIMVAAFILASLIGAVIFGDAGFILKPDIEKYGALQR